MAVDYKQKGHYEIDDLLEIMRLLRSPDGCHWDREQTNQSIRSNLLEETHEAIEAINQGDANLLCEELGDILLQIVFHCQIQQENSQFGFSDVVDGICKKLIIRHPHVFSDAKDTGKVAQLKYVETGLSAFRTRNVLNLDYLPGTHQAYLHLQEEYYLLGLSVYKRIDKEYYSLR